jgi:hypothetical protein
MKYAPVIVLPFFFYGTVVANAQTYNTVKEIQQLEKAPCDAIVQHDTATLYKIWAEDFTVTTPADVVVKLEGSKYAFRTGLTDYWPLVLL